MHHFVAHRFQHAPDLPKFSLSDRHPDYTPALIAGDYSGFASKDSLSLESHATFQKVHGLVSYLTIHGYLVNTGHSIARMGEAVSAFTIIAKKQKPKCIEIETSDRINPLRDFPQEIGDQGPAFRIAQGADVAEWFVEHEIEPFGRPWDFFIIYPDTVEAPNSPGTWVRDQVIIDHYPSRFDPLVGLSP